MDAETNNLDEIRAQVGKAESILSSTSASHGCMSNEAKWELDSIEYEMTFNVVPALVAEVELLRAALADTHYD